MNDKPPVPAATILMLRDGEQGLEVFMVVTPPNRFRLWRAGFSRRKN